MGPAHRGGLRAASGRSWAGWGRGLRSPLQRHLQLAVAMARGAADSRGGPGRGDLLSMPGTWGPAGLHPAPGRHFPGDWTLPTGLPGCSQDALAEPLPPWALVSAFISCLSLPVHQGRGFQTRQAASPPAVAQGSLSGMCSADKGQGVQARSSPKQRGLFRTPGASRGSGGDWVHQDRALE